MAQADVTSPGDVIRGVPNDGDWPGGENPALAIDDRINTKYLHFKGETQPTGFQVTPSLGPTVVTGLTLTTANDAAERDPVAFALYGSNVSIDGPYTRIADGDVVDFAQGTAWPRFTTNATPITFANTMAYTHYQLLFPRVEMPPGQQHADRRSGAAGPSGGNCPDPDPGNPRSRSQAPPSSSASSKRSTKRACQQPSRERLPTPTGSSCVTAGRCPSISSAGT
jgi:hypothetical protein